MPDPHEQRPKSDFIAAEEIKGILHGREKLEQERIIRWVSESLSLAAVPARTTGQVPSPPASVPAQSGPQHSSHVLERGKDIGAFVTEKHPKNDVHFATVVAYFYRFEVSESDRKDTITPDDLQEAARKAPWHRFPKPAVPLNNAVGQGYLDRAGGGAFKLNAVGENLVAMTLPGADGDNGPARSSKKRAKRRVPKQTKKRKAS